MITGAEPGVTRDAVCVQWEYDGRIVNVVDTAGIQRGTAGLKFQDDEVRVCVTLVRAISLCVQSRCCFCRRVAVVQSVTPPEVDHAPLFLVV